MPIWNPQRELWREVLNILVFWDLCKKEGNKGK